MKKVKTKILLAEDDLNLGALLKDYLEMEDFEVSLCRDGEDALVEFKRLSFDICIFDVMMPKKDGFTLAKDIRKNNKTIPIIYLTAKALKEDKIEGFKTGADDYITKPFDEEELVYRIKAILKRSGTHNTENPDTVFKIGKFSFDYSRQLLSYDGGDQKRITSRESEILKLLYQRKNNILKREDALLAIWGENDYFHGRSFDVFITKLRKYLKADNNIKIENIHGVGFMLVDNS